VIALFELLEGGVGLRGEIPGAGARDAPVAHERGFEAMILERQVELAAQRAHAFVARADPFAAEFADEIGILRKAERVYAPAVSLACFEHGHIPMCVLERVSGGQTRQTRADDDARRFRAATRLRH
jgi:hypothetical protein